jgi:ACS family tartrate transporter-like MFS transporter
VAWRLLPLIFCLYIVSYLDRANVAFAKLSMVADLRFSEADFGFGAGLFFIGYLTFQIPGALLVERQSARKWIGSLSIVWGLCAMATGFAHTASQFSCARFFLGVAEAGFFPGIISYLSHWFPAQDRARAASGFIVAVPLSIGLGAPVSALMLRWPLFGLAGWRWMFVGEGMPAVVLGVLTFVWLTDRPGSAQWLSAEERAWLCHELEKQGPGKQALDWKVARVTLLDRSVLCLALALLLVVMGGYGFLFWLPTVIKNKSDVTVTGATLWAAVPFIAGAITVVLAGWSSDRWRERRHHAAVPMALAGLFFLGSAIPHLTFEWLMFWLCLTGAMAYSWAPAFWTIPTLLLSGPAAALALAFINSVGNCGGFLGPSLTGYLLTHGWRFSEASVLLSGFFVTASIFVWLGPHGGEVDKFAPR